MPRKKSKCRKKLNKDFPSPTNSASKIAKKKEKQYFSLFLLEIMIWGPAKK